MQTQNQDDLSTINDGVISRYNKNHATLTHFQSVDGGGWVPGQSGEDQVNRSSIADYLKKISTGSDADVADQLRALVNALTKADSGEVVVQSHPNVSGVTRSPLVIKSSDRGARAKVVDAQAFQKNETNGNVLHLSKGNSLIKTCKADTLKAQAAKSLKSHEDPTVELKVNRDSILNMSRIDKQNIASLHADKSSKDAVLRFNAVQKEREARLARGQGTVDDAVARRNAVMYCHSGMSGVRSIDSSILAHENAYFDLMLETEKLNRK